VAGADISTSFKETIFIPRGVHKYFLTVTCGDLGSYRSEIFELGGPRRSSHPIDLGIIRLTVKEGNGPAR
jgi:hypothetical protein